MGGKTLLVCSFAFLVLVTQYVCFPQASGVSAPVDNPELVSALEQPDQEFDQANRTTTSTNSIMTWLVALVSVMVLGMMSLLGFALRYVQGIAKEVRETAREAMKEAAEHVERITIGAHKASDEADASLNRVRRLEADVKKTYWIIKANAWIGEAALFEEDHPLRTLYYGLAEEALSDAVELDPSDGTACIWKAWLRKRHGFIEEALRLVEGAIQNSDLHPHEVARAYYNAACYCALLSDQSSAKAGRAIDHLKIAIEKHEIFRVLARTDEDFASLRDSQAFQDLIN